MVGQTQISNKNKSTAFCLCLFFGLFGAHRFYVGKVGTGVFYLLTVGGIYIGWIVDLVMILCNRFKDKNGYIIKSERAKKKDSDKSGYTTTSAPNCNNLQNMTAPEDYISNLIAAGKEPISTSPQDNHDIFVPDSKGNVYKASGAPITDDDIPYLIELGMNAAMQAEKTSSNPKFHRSERDEDLMYRFTETHGAKSDALCEAFENLYQEASQEKDIDNKIEKLQACVAAFEKAKDWHYKRSKGGMMYFQDNWEYLHNSRNECFSWVDSVTDEIDFLQEDYPYIVETIKTKAQGGFMQPKIYAELPDYSQSMIRNIISDLAGRGEIQKVKKGRSYYIST